MAKWLSKQTGPQQELWCVRRLLWLELAKNAELTSRLSDLEQELQTIGLELDAIILNYDPMPDPDS